MLKYLFLMEKKYYGVVHNELFKGTDIRSQCEAEISLFTGLPAQKPEFMESHIKKRKHTVPNSDSDEEWKPSSEKTKRIPG